jgi:hypothetical protein
MRVLRLVPFFLLTPLAAAGQSLAPEQEAFWERLQAFCDQAFAGEVSDVTEFYREALVGRELLADGVSCEEEAIHIALHVDDNRSRNWILTRADGTIRLKHDHR